MNVLIDSDIVLGKVWIDGNGYARHGKDCYVHRTVAQLTLGRALLDTEIVHHCNHNKNDNRWENLMVLANDKEHRHQHALEDILNAGYDPETFHYCSYHKCYEVIEKFSTRPTGWRGLHNMCREATNTYRKTNGYKTKFTWKQRLQQQYHRALKQSVPISWLKDKGTQQCSSS